MEKYKNLSSNGSMPVSPFSPHEASFYNVPDSPASTFVLDILGAGEDIADLPERKQQVSHGAAIEVLENGIQRKITLDSPTASVTVELADVEKLTGSNKPAKKLFVLALIKANEQSIHNGQLTRDYISFPLQELIDTGFYSTPQSARKGFRAGCDILTSLKVSGKATKSKKIEDAQESGRVLFTGFDINKGQCVIYLNNHVNWAFIAQYFTILPTYYFRLSNRASDLLYYIFYLARQRTREIEKKGYFTISFRAIQHKLMLPNEKGLNNPQRDIKDAIEKAIEELEEEHRKTYASTDFSLLPVYDDSASIGDYLDNGYLKVSLSGSFANTFIEISKETNKQIGEYHKRQERIQEKAIALATSKKLEKKDESGSN